MRKKSVLVLMFLFYGIGGKRTDVPPDDIRMIHKLFFVPYYVYEYVCGCVRK